MTRMWISFANYGDPNNNLGGKHNRCLPTETYVRLTDSHFLS